MAAQVAAVIEAEQAAVAAIEKAFAAEGVKIEPPEVSATPSGASAERAAGTTPMKIDYAKLKLTGHGMPQDSWSLIVCAAAGLLGRQADYEAVYALSANAFAPAIDTGEGCQAWWHMFGRDSGLDILGGRFGLKFEVLKLPEGAYTPQDSREVFDRKASEQRRAAATILRKAMAEGRVLLTTYGWRGQTDHGFVPWCWWGIITEVRDDGTMAGAQLNGRLDNPLDFVDICYAVSPVAVNLSPHEADMLMLKRAVERIRGRKPEPHGAKLCLGLYAMDVWIKQMAEVRYFCPECQERVGRDPGRGGFRCAFSNGQSMQNGSKVAAAYLRKCKGSFNAGAQPHLEAVANHYDRIVELFGPAMTGKGGDNYEAICGDMDKQKAHAGVLGQVKAELAAAADEMEQALAAEGVDVGAIESEVKKPAPPVESSNGAAMIVRTGEATRIQGVPALAWGGKRDNTFAGALAAALSITKRPVSYEDLMGFSGLAFRVRWHAQFCPSSPVGEMPEEIEAIEKVTGWKIQVDVQLGQKNPDMAAFLPKIIASLDAGWPVLAYDKDLNVGVIVGYTGAEKTLLTLNYGQGQAPRRINIAKLGAMQLYPRPTSEPMDEKQATLAALRIAATNWHRGVTNPKGVPQSYAYGKSAMDAWGEALKTVDRLPQKERDALLFLTWWNFQQLVDARTAAAAFCKKHAAVFNGETRKIIERAAGIYAKERDLLDQSFTAKDTFLGPWTGKKPEDWTAAVRDHERQILAEFARLDSDAVVELERVLAP